MRVLPLTVSALALATAALGCSRGDAKTLVESRPRMVRAARVIDTTVARPIVAAGTVAPADEIALGFKIGGVIGRVWVDEGDPVRAGQTLAALDLREIDAGLSKARSGAEKAERDLARARRLYADSVVTLVQLQDAETGAEMARADLKSAGVNRRYAEIVAPANGVVLRRLAESGENIEAGAAVVVIGSKGEGHASVLEVGLADRDAVTVRIGDPAVVRFDALPGHEAAGRISRIGAAADPATGTYEVEIELTDSRSLAAGLVGRAEIRPSRGASASLIPIEAVLEADGDNATVYAVTSDGARAQRRRVSIGFLHDGKVAVMGGLEGVTRVVTDGAAYLDDGSSVRVAP
jgi:membrane fusion protein, multidrug efflux system